MSFEAASHKLRTRPSASVRLRSMWDRWLAAWQDRYIQPALFVSISVFVLAILAGFWILRTELFDVQTESVKRDTEITQQQIRLRLIENQEQLVRIAREVVTRQVDASEFAAQAHAFALERPELTHVSWLNERREERARTGIGAAGFQSDGQSKADGSDPSLPQLNQSNAAEIAFAFAKARRLPVYSQPFADSAGVTVFQLQIPLLDRTGFTGVLVAEYSVEALLRYYIPSEVAARHSVALLDSGGQVISSTVAPKSGQLVDGKRIVHEVPLTPALNGLVLRGSGYRTSIGLASSLWFWVLLTLSFFTVVLLVSTRRQMRRRMQAHSALAAETNFRRSIDGSMPTAMRAIDMDGKISFVNPAFCAMTGFLEAELVGQEPPYPFWPAERLEENEQLHKLQIQGRSPPDGQELRIKRKDGTTLDVRMYVSPLVGVDGKQNGWMGSMIPEMPRNNDSNFTGREFGGEGFGDGGYIVIDLQDAHKAMFHDVLKGFEDYSRLRGYSISFAVDGSISNKIAFKFTVLQSSTEISAATVQEDLKEYIRRVQTGDVDLNDLPRVIPFEQHEALLLAMRNRILFLQHTYQAQKNVLEFYERALKDFEFKNAAVAPSQIFYLQTGGNMSPTNYIASGSTNVVQGDHNQATQSIRIAESFNEKKQQLDDLGKLIAVLINAHPGEAAKKAVINLEKVKDELTMESKPDESRVKRWLDTAKDSMKTLALGKDVFEMAVKVFKDFNLDF